MMDDLNVAAQEKLYLETPYEPLIPLSSNKDQFTFKFNSITHFVGWVEHLYDKFGRGSNMTTSDDRGSGFAGSYDWSSGIEAIRTTAFDDMAKARLQKLISKIKKKTKFSNEGYEIEVPEFIAGSQNHWISDTPTEKRSKIIDKTFFLGTSYNAGTDCEAAKRAGIELVSEIYRLGVVPRKMVCNFSSFDSTSRKNEFNVFIDVSFADLDGIAKTLHPSVFRRLIFRMYEIYPDLNGGYGKSREFKTKEGVTSVKEMITTNRALIEGKTKTLLGIKS